ncbi:hypothetical protein Tco_0673763 [Tanacetum coccineum]|uniref:Uncharacterized protein n=1 Tax=Tanacetum coccineum TaxID=301880 RepID=A0ABQ5F1I1_9ASTR
MVTYLRKLMEMQSFHEIINYLGAKLPSRCSHYSMSRVFSGKESRSNRLTGKKILKDKQWSKRRQYPKQGRNIAKAEPSVQEERQGAEKEVIMKMPLDKGKKKIEEEESDTESEDINESEKKLEMLAHDEVECKKGAKYWESRRKK